MEYVSKVLLEINGSNIDDFKSVEESEVEINKKVPLMGSTGTIAVTPRYEITVDYVVPKDAAEFDFNTVKGGTLTIDKTNGVRVKFSGVTTEKIGATAYDGEKEATRKITFMATGKK
ncbi:MAG: hypothetical protein HY243_12345 [Proteobacteria bacterium]|nr:hypothetical protein [Pseudomonadota bacterium]